VTRRSVGLSPSWGASSFSPVERRATPALRGKTVSRGFSKLSAFAGRLELLHPNQTNRPQSQSGPADRDVGPHGERMFARCQWRFATLAFYTVSRFRYAATRPANRTVWRPGRMRSRCWHRARPVEPDFDFSATGHLPATPTKRAAKSSHSTSSRDAVLRFRTPASGRRFPRYSLRSVNETSAGT